MEADPSAQFPYQELNFAASSQKIWISRLLYWISSFDLLAVNQIGTRALYSSKILWLGLSEKLSLVLSTSNDIKISRKKMFIWPRKASSIKNLPISNVESQMLT